MGTWLENLVSENPSITEIILVFSSVAVLLTVSALVVVYVAWQFFKRGS